jgi:resuscitation-promoting factor RpfB
MAACLAVTLLFAGFVASKVGAATNDTAKDGRLVTIHDRGNDKVILTHAQSIRDALNEADVNLDNKDTVEPGLDEKLVATDYTVNIYRARPVIVVDGAIRQKIMTAYQTADKITQDAGIELHDEDKTTLKPSDDVVSDGAGLQLVIDRATPFTLVLYGTKTVTYTQEKTVAAMLKSKHISIKTEDTLSVSENTPMKSGMVIELWRNGKQTVTEEQVVAFETEKIQDADREIGYRQIKTPGVEGKKSVTYEIEMRNGKEVGRKEIQSVVTQQSKKQVEIVGAKPVFSGNFAAALAKLRACESGGNYANKKNPLYRGAYQYGYSTWANKYGIHDPADATPAQQDQAAWETYQRRGWQPWPNCGKGLPDTYR